MIATDIHEHVITPENILREFFRVLKKGGRVIATAPYFRSSKMDTCLLQYKIFQT
ncbi:MAG: hypothetical protein JW774_11370 [Candidatus Aureabacteria bacterium]|nr:hypothetical protein [Candidatus Auribacterota bacterium]